MVYQPKKVKVTLLADRTFGTTQGEAGKTYDVEPFWADALIAEGSAEVVTEEKKGKKADKE